MDCRNHSFALALASCICGVVPLILAPPLMAQDRSRVAAVPALASSPEFIENQGIVLPNRRFTLKLRPGERLDEVLVAKGEHVKAGHPLARISDPTLTERYVNLTLRRNDYQALRGELESKTLELSLQRAALQRVMARIEKLQKLEGSTPDYSGIGDADPLIDKKFELQDQIEKGSQQQLQLQHRLDLMQDMVGAIERELGTAQSRVAHNLVLAPFAGDVVDRIIEGNRPDSETVVCELWDESTYLVEVEILQHQVSYVQPGRKAVIAIDFTRPETVEGTVSYLEPGNLAPESLGHPRFKAVIALKQPVSWLRPGMQVAVRMRVDGKK
jgi:multidrug efflux pump subunit AcrA (membrane-fusion protein)